MHSLGDTHCRFSAKLFSEWLHLSLPAAERALADLTPPAHCLSVARTHCGNVACMAAWCRTRRSGLGCATVCVSVAHSCSCAHVVNGAHYGGGAPPRIAARVLCRRSVVVVVAPIAALLKRCRLTDVASHRPRCAALQPLPSQLPSLSALCAVTVLSFRIELRCSVHFSTRLLPLHALGRRGTSLLRPADYGDASQLVMVMARSLLDPTSDSRPNRSQQPQRQPVCTKTTWV